MINPEQKEGVLNSSKMYPSLIHANGKNMTYRQTLKWLAGQTFRTGGPHAAEK